MDTQPDMLPSDPGQSLRPRRKARLACNPCRARKTGCDGRKPICSACTLRGWQDKCIYPDTVLQPSTALTLVDIDRRLQKLESEIRGDAAAASRHGTPMPTSIATGAGSDAPASVDVPAGFSASYVPLNSDTTSLATSKSRTRPTSATSEQDSPLFPGFVDFSLHGSDQRLEGFDPQAIALPTRQFADDLLRCYWVNIHSMFPFVHWPTFDADYRALWKQQGFQKSAYDQLLFLATLNMILALGSLTNAAIQLDHRHIYGDEFYQRSLRLISAETLDSATIPAVQLLLLRSLYLYFAGRAERCWLVSAAAVRLAIGMCLHLTPKRHLSQLEREIRRRVWYAGCVTIDLILSTTFGRPPMIDHNLPPVPPPQAIDEEYLSATHEAKQPEGVPCRLDLLLESMKLAPVTSEIRALGRAPRIKLDHDGTEIQVPDPSIILRLNSRLDDALSSAPPHLRLGADYSSMSLSEDAVRAFRVQSYGHHIRILLLRVMLLRSSILAEAQRWASSKKPPPTSSTSVTLHERFHQEICALCLQTVHSALQEIHGSLTMYGIMSAWYALHLTFASCLILIVATLSPNLGVNLDAEPAKTSWDRAMAILDFHKANLASAGRAIDVLQKSRAAIVARAARASPKTTVAVPGESMGSTTGPQPMYLPQHAQPAQSQHPLGQPPQQWNVPVSAPFTGPGAVPSVVSQAPILQALTEYITSDSLDEAWLAMQDFGHGDWLLRY